MGSFELSLAWVQTCCALKCQAPDPSFLLGGALFQILSLVDILMHKRAS